METISTFKDKITGECSWERMTTVRELTFTNGLSGPSIGGAVEQHMDPK